MWPSSKGPDLKLLPQLRGIALGIHSQHLFVGDRKLVHQDGRLSAKTRLQDGIMDEDILLLKRQRVTVKTNMDPNG